MFAWRVLVVSVDSEGSLRGGGLCIISMDTCVLQTNLISDEVLFASGGLQGDGISS